MNGFQEITFKQHFIQSDVYLKIEKFNGFLQKIK